MLRTPTASQGEGGALGEETARARGNTVGIRDNAMDLAALNGLKVSRTDLLPTPAVGHIRNHDEPIEDYLERRQDYLDGKTKGMPGASLGVAVRIETLPTPTTRDFKDGKAEHERNGVVQTDTIGRAVMNSGEIDEINWGKFEPAIRRWEQVTGRPAPAPTKPDGKDGAHRLNSKLTEWMMGIPDGWITDCGLSRKDELKAAGNGVVPQQAKLALQILLNS